MKKIIVGSLSTFLLVGLAAPAGFAQSNDRSCPVGTSQGTMDTSMSGMNVRDTEAFNLVSLAYRGEFEEEGVPSYNRLVMEYTTGDLSAMDVVQAGVEDGYLAPAALEDEAYINAVELQLDAFGISGS